MEEVIKLQVTNLVQRNVGDFAKSNSANRKVYQHPNFVGSTYSAMYTTLNIDSQLAIILCCIPSLQSSVCSV